MNRSIILAAIIISITILLNGFLERRVHIPPTPSPPATSVASVNQTIAALPFTTSSSDGADNSLANGIRSEIITRLTAQHVKAAGAREPAHAAAFLRGSVQRAGNRIRINVQLVDAATGTPDWAESYERELTDVFALESEIAENVAKSIVAQQKT